MGLLVLTRSDSPCKKVKDEWDIARALPEMPVLTLSPAGSKLCASSLSLDCGDYRLLFKERLSVAVNF